MLQFIFLGNTGFRFPFAHCPTKEADAATLYDLFWNAVLWILKAGIVVTYCCCDGGEANRPTHLRNRKWIPAFIYCGLMQTAMEV